MKNITLIVVIILMAGLVAFAITSIKTVQASGAQQKSNDPQLSGVRLRGQRKALELIRAAAAEVRWTQSSYDKQGRLILASPPNYTSDDFGRLLEAIDPFMQNVKGLQMLGPHGGPVDADGIEHVDKR